MKWTGNDKAGVCNTSKSSSGELGIELKRNSYTLGIMSSWEAERRTEESENFKGFACSGNISQQ